MVVKQIQRNVCKKQQHRDNVTKRRHGRMRITKERRKEKIENQTKIKINKIHHSQRENNQKIMGYGQKRD